MSQYDCPARVSGGGGWARDAATRAVPALFGPSVCPPHWPTTSVIGWRSHQLTSHLVRLQQHCYIPQTHLQHPAHCCARCAGPATRGDTVMALLRGRPDMSILVRVVESAGLEPMLAGARVAPCTAGMKRVQSDTCSCKQSRTALLTVGMLLRC